jgi:formiminotetrahydrofolate cyclodeaminase
VVSDAATAIYLAQAALLAGIANVNVNLKLIKDEAFVDEWEKRRNAVLDEMHAAVEISKAACAATIGVTL